MYIFRSYIIIEATSSVLAAEEVQGAILLMVGLITWMFPIVAKQKQTRQSKVCVHKGAQDVQYEFEKSETGELTDSDVVPLNIQSKFVTGQIHRLSF